MAVHEALGRYLDLLETWAGRANLTAIVPGERVHVLVEPVLSLLPFLEPGPLLDVGSGNGSPGLVLALLRPELPTTLLEPRAKRWAFLREAARATGRPDIQVLRQRHDAYQGPLAQSLTVRALRLPLAEFAPLLREGGRLLLMGQAPGQESGFFEERALAGPTGPVHVFRRGTGAAS